MNIYENRRSRVIWCCHEAQTHFWWHNGLCSWTKCGSSTGIWGSPGAAHPGVWPWEIKTRHCATLVTAISQQARLWCRNLNEVCMQVLLQYWFFVVEQSYRSYFGISRKGKVWKSTTVQHFTWHHLWDLPKLFRDKNLKLKRTLKKQQHLPTPALASSLSCLFSFSHTDMCVHTLAAVGPLSGDQRQSLDPPAPRWGQNLGQASTEPPSPYAARNTVPLSTGPERRTH